MLESIYNIGSGSRTGPGGSTSPLARYLASVGGAAGAGGPAKTGTVTDSIGGPLAPFAQPLAPLSEPAAQPAAQPAGAGNQANPTLPQISTDYSSDPALQQIMSGGIRDSADADAAALGARRSALAQYGDRGLAEKVLGAGDPTLGSISDDPANSTSQLARMHRAYADTTKGITDNDNANNLFYGGHHILNLENAAKDEQTQEADANAAIHAALDQIGAGLATTKGNIADTEAQGESAAADRAAQAAMLQALYGGLGGTDPTDPTGGTGVISSVPYDPTSISSVPSDPTMIGGSQVDAPRPMSDPVGKITPAQLEAIVARLFPRAGGGPVAQ